MLSTRYSRFLRQSFEVEFMRWVLVLIFLMFGYTKWFDYEAQALVPLISNSPSSPGCTACLALRVQVMR